MELYKELLINLLQKEQLHICFPDMKLDFDKILEMECYKYLHKIKAIINDDSLTDFNCMEKIICLFKEMGSKVGNRHDY